MVYYRAAGYFIIGTVVVFAAGEQAVIQAVLESGVCINDSLYSFCNTLAVWVLPS